MKRDMSTRLVAFNPVISTQAKALCAFETSMMTLTKTGETANGRMHIDIL